jgi:hypothetical protein
MVCPSLDQREQPANRKKRVLMRHPRAILEFQKHLKDSTSKPLSSLCPTKLAIGKAASVQIPIGGLILIVPGQDFTLQTENRTFDKYPDRPMLSIPLPDIHHFP